MDNVQVEVPRAKRPRPDQRLCPHWDEILSYKTYRAHKRLHYNCEAILPCTFCMIIFHNDWFKLDACCEVETLERNDPHSLEDNSPDLPDSHEPDCAQNQPLEEIRAESPPLSEPALSSFSDDHQSEFDSLQFDSDNQQSSG